MKFILKIAKYDQNQFMTRKGIINKYFVWGQGGDKKTFCEFYFVFLYERRIFLYFITQRPFEYYISVLLVILHLSPPFCKKKLAIVRSHPYPFAYVRFYEFFMQSNYILLIISSLFNPYIRIIITPPPLSCQRK